jgi:hypothetical protein
MLGEKPVEVAKAPAIRNFAVSRPSGLLAGNEGFQEFTSGKPGGAGWHEDSPSARSGIMAHAAVPTSQKTTKETLA